MPKVKGKKPTREQRSILSRSGIKDAENWLYWKTTFVAADGSKNASHNTSTVMKMEFVNKDTGETIII